MYIQNDKILKTRILELQKSAKISEAISLCDEIVKKYQSDYYYPNILGDLYFQQRNFRMAANAFIIFLKRISGDKKLFSDFANRYNRLKRELDSAAFEVFVEQLAEEIEAGNLNEQVANWTKILLQTDIKNAVLFSSEGQKIIESIVNNNYNIFVEKAKLLEEINSPELEAIFNQYILNRTRTKETYIIDKYCISVYERFSRHEKAINIALELLKVKYKSALIRSILHSCRIIKNYTAADKIIASYPIILESSAFNINYELIYYYGHHNDIEKITAILNRMELGGKYSVSIQKTIRNFYLTFGMPDEARRVDKYLLDINPKKSQFYEEEKESEAEIGSKIRELYSEIDHHKRLAAISDLTSGISHELGQPITNIRYTVQFYYKLFQKSVSKEEVFKVFDSILEETKRMGDLVKRLSPLTSSRNMIENFDLMSHIKKRIHAEKNRLQELKITVQLKPNRPFYIIGDPVHFDQIINNLLLNSIDSLSEYKSTNKKLMIDVKEKQDEVIIIFADNGLGIAADYRGKIFDPFFTTKGPGKGEGLGLFIIWNLLKIHGGKVTLDTENNRGARFIVAIPKKTAYSRELSI